MHISSNLSKISLIIVLFSLNGSFGFIWLPNLLAIPGKVIGSITSIFDSTPAEVPTTIPPPPPIVTKSIPVEETIFGLPSRIQSFFDPGDVQVKPNYIMSPLSAGILLGELLIGTQDWYHQYLAKIMNFSPTEANNKSKEDEQIYHSLYHFKFARKAKNLQSERPNQVLRLNNAFYFKRTVQLAETFENKLGRLYESEIVPLSLNDLSDSVDPIIQWSEKNMKISLKNQTFRMVNAETRSILINNFVFNTTWKFPLKEWWRQEAFYSMPYENENKKITYLKGDMQNIIYATAKTYDLVGIPLGHENINLYILLPTGSDFVIYDIRTFSEGLSDFKEFKKTLKTAELRDVKLKLPNIFKRFVELDYIKPILNYINEENKFIVNRSKTDVIMMNSAAYFMELNNVIQYMYFSISDAITDNKDGITDDVKQENSKEKLEKVKFEVTRPFVFIIMDETTNLVLVWGSISDPEMLK